MNHPTSNEPPLGARASGPHASEQSPLPVNQSRSSHMNHPTSNEASLGARASGPHASEQSPLPVSQSRSSHMNYPTSNEAPLGARASGPHASEQIPQPIHQGWYSRGYLPHFDQPGLLQSINFRLHDSVPASLLEQWRQELRLHDLSSEQKNEAEALRRLIEEYEDQGQGECYLRDPRVAALVENAFLHFDGDRYRLIEWCVMPNHVHVLIETCEGHPLSRVVNSWKTFTSREANLLLRRKGMFWMPDYYDRFIRDQKHLSAVRRYIRNNPVKAGLCATPEEWPWGSARRECAGVSSNQA